MPSGCLEITNLNIDYVENIDINQTERELLDMFEKYGKVLHITFYVGRGNLTAYVLFEDERDAADALACRGKIINSSSIKIYECMTPEDMQCYKPPELTGF